MSHTERDVQAREIITKAVCGKGKKYSQATHTLTPENSPTSILGCWIINHSYTATKVDDVVEISGSYDINVWYSFKNNTKTEVSTETVSYMDQVPLVMTDQNLLDQNVQVVASATQEPTACEATVSNSGQAVYVQAEREFLVEVIGETKLCVLVSPNGCQDPDDKEFAFDESDNQTYDDLDAEIMIDDLD